MFTFHVFAKVQFNNGVHNKAGCYTINRDPRNTGANAWKCLCFAGSRQHTAGGARSCDALLTRRVNIRCLINYR